MRLFPERIAQIKARVLEVLSASELPRLSQGLIHARIGIEVTRQDLTEILTSLRAGRVVCFDPARSEYWMANRNGGTPDALADKVVSILRELGEATVEQVAEKAGIDAEQAGFTLKRLRQAGRVCCRKATERRINGGVVVLMLYRAGSMRTMLPEQRARKVRATLRGLKQLGAE